MKSLVGVSVKNQSEGMEPLKTIYEAIERTFNMFPFEGYIRPEYVKSQGPYSNIGNIVLKYLPRGSSILDFGCGPCDKTAVLQHLGFNCSAYDDFRDDWHVIDDNKEKIVSFANDCGIDLKMAGESEILPFAEQSFDMVMLHDVLEHLHDSPRDLLDDLLGLVKPDGLIFVTVPNAVNIRKRVSVLLGKTNLPSFESYYWYHGPWRGHVREYVKSDLSLLAEYLNCEILELHGSDHMIHKVPSVVRNLYVQVTNIRKGVKDTWLLVARKKANWKSHKSISSTELNSILGKSTGYQYDH
tara:strand:+ start:295 stop:1188 length:894 start_codon:yes stop_codon:yes gene_type:complete